MHAGLDLADFQAKLFTHFGPGTEYEKTTQEAAQNVRPVNGPWANGAVKNFLKTYVAKEPVTGDPANKDMDALFSAIPVMVLHAGKPDLQEQVEKTVRVLQVRPQAQAVCNLYGSAAVPIICMFPLLFAYTHTHTLLAE